MTCSACSFIAEYLSASEDAALSCNCGNLSLFTVLSLCSRSSVVNGASVSTILCAKHSLPMFDIEPNFALGLPEQVANAVKSLSIGPVGQDSYLRSFVLEHRSTFRAPAGTPA